MSGNESFLPGKALQYFVYFQLFQRGTAGNIRRAAFWYSLQTSPKKRSGQTKFPEERVTAHMAEHPFYESQFWGIQLQWQQSIRSNHLCGHS